jgi:hypothetical protein
LEGHELACTIKYVIGDESWDVFRVSDPSEASFSTLMLLLFEFARTAMFGQARASRPPCRPEALDEVLA